MEFKDKIKKFCKNNKKKIIGAAIALPIITGTFLNKPEGSIPPLNNIKVGNSYGINVGFCSEFEKDSKHYGINIGFVTYYSLGSELNGLNISLLTIQESDINGVSLSAFSAHEDGIINGVKGGFWEGGGGEMGQNPKTNGLEVIVIDEGRREMEGFQIGVNNYAKSENCVQFGIYNSIQKPNKKHTRSCLVNWYFQDKNKSQGDKK